RALAVAPSLGDAVVVPALIETLALWVGRRDTDSGSRRVEAAVVAELRRRSGTSIGAFPERWSQWWRARSSGALGEPAKGAMGEATKANFFGLRPQTDRVTFVIDRSGSMETPGPSGESRYHEALEQLAGFVEALGPKARFRVILFDSSVHIWKEMLQPATPAALSAAKSWVGAQRPAGGTNLKPAIERLMKAVSGETPDAERLEEDTVIVLCDGATAEGADWVEPFWEEVGWRSEVIFHCVQLGGGGNGTLEELARVSGGEFVRAP
ncbi:MAG: VWA domain-containing protein, partial [Planctomycetota bacterium]|nr:VWA domain-containing protein [Planctomycetota bacterium]